MGSKSQVNPAHKKLIKIIFVGPLRWCQWFWDNGCAIWFVGWNRAVIYKLLESSHCSSFFSSLYWIVLTIFGVTLFPILFGVWDPVNIDINEPHPHRKLKEKTWILWEQTAPISQSSLHGAVRKAWYLGIHQKWKVWLKKLTELIILRRLITEDRHVCSSTFSDPFGGKAVGSCFHLTKILKYSLLDWTCFYCCSLPQELKDYQEYWKQEHQPLAEDGEFPTENSHGQDAVHSDGQSLGTPRPNFQ